DAEPGKQRVDLEGACESALDALVLRHCGHVLVAEVHRAGSRRMHAGQQVDEGGLAGAVGPGQRVARPFGQREVDAVVGANAAPMLGKADGAQGGLHDRALHRARRAASAPRIPPRANNTISTSSRPSQNCQYTASMPDSHCCASMNTAAPTMAP